MQCRPPRKIKRYMTDPDECPTEHKSKYSNMTLQELKLQVSGIDTLNEISVPTVCPTSLNQQRTPTTFMPLHPKFHLRRNPLKRLPDLNTQSSSNGYEPPKPLKGPHIFKRSNPLFVVNSLFGTPLPTQTSSKSKPTPNTNPSLANSPSPRNGSPNRLTSSPSSTEKASKSNEGPD